MNKISIFGFTLCILASCALNKQAEQTSINQPLECAEILTEEPPLECGEIVADTNSSVAQTNTMVYNINDTFPIEIPNVNEKALASFANAEGKLAAIKYIQFVDGVAICTTDGLTAGTYTVTIRIKGQSFSKTITLN